MKNLLLLVAFCSATLFSSAQYTIVNSTAEELTIGVQFTDTYGDCAPDADDWETVAPYSSHTFTIPPGMMIFRIGYWGDSGSGFIFTDCGGCTSPDSPGPFSIAASCMQAGVY